MLSSQIEGTQSSLSDLLLFENEESPGVPVADVKEVLNYVAALEYGIKRLKELPISLRLIKEIHMVLLKGGRGKEPGEFRRSQNWIGGSRPGNAKFVPPPPHEVLPALGALASPLLYLSLYFKIRRTEYYEALQRVRTEGDWEGWLAFYLDGIGEVANQASDTASKLVAIFKEHAAACDGLGRSKGTALRLHELFKKRCILSIPVACRELGVSFPTASKTLGKQRHRVFSYEPYLRLLQEGMDVA